MQASRPFSQLAIAAALAGAAFAAAAQPQYTIADIGRPTGNNLGHASGISPSGDYAVGRGLLGASQPNKAYLWTEGSGLAVLPASSTNNWSVAVNDSGVAVGQTSINSTVGNDNAGNTYFSDGAPAVWKNGSVTTLAASGRIYGINSAGIAVGSMGGVGAANQFATIFDTNNPGTNSFIFATSAEGAMMRTATGINNSGLILGVGSLDTGAGIVNSSLLYNPATGTMTTIASGASVSALTTTSITASDINNNGAVVGSILAFNPNGSTNASLNQPYSWTADGGLQAVALPSGMVGGMAIGINDQGWIVGVARNGADANNYPFLNIAGTSYLLSSLVTLPAGTSFNSTTIAGIANDGTILAYASGISGTGLRAFTLNVSAVPEPSSYALLLAGLAAVGGIARRRRQAAAA